MILDVDLETGKVVATVPLPPLRVEGAAVANAVTFSPDGKTLYLGDAAGRVLAFDWNTKAFREEFLSDPTSIRDLMAREDSLTVSGRGVTHFYWYGDPRRLFLHALPYPPVAALATGETRAVALHNGRIESVESDTFRRMTGGPRVDATCFAFSPDSASIALAGRDGQIVIRETARWKLVRSWKAHDSPVSRLLWNPNGRQLASCGDNEITFWDLTSGEETRTLSFWGRFRAKGVSFDASGGQVTIPERVLPKVGLYDTHSFQHLGVVSSGPSSVRADMLLTADGRQLYVGANGTNATLWDIQRDAAIRTFPARTGADVSLELSPDEKTLYTASNRDVNAFDVATGKTLWTLKAHTELIRDLARHPADPIVASVANDGTLVITEAQTGTLIERMRLGPIRGELHQVDFSPDGSLLAVGMNNGAVVVLESPILD